jgi:hypothetical protein
VFTVVNDILDYSRGRQQRCLDAGMQSVIKTPVNAGDLGATIERYLPVNRNSD